MRMDWERAGAFSCFAGTSGIVLYAAATTGTVHISMISFWALMIAIFWSDCARKHVGTLAGSETAQNGIEA